MQASKKKGAPPSREDVSAPLLFYNPWVEQSESRVTASVDPSKPFEVDQVREKCVPDEKGIDVRTLAQLGVCLSCPRKLHGARFLAVFKADPEAILMYLGRFAREAPRLAGLEHMVVFHWVVREETVAWPVREKPIDPRRSVPFVGSRAHALATRCNRSGLKITWSTPGGPRHSPLRQQGDEICPILCVWLCQSRGHLSLYTLMPRAEQTLENFIRDMTRCPDDKHLRVRFLMDALTILVRVALGLVQLAAAGIEHHDMLPRNIFLLTYTGRCHAAYDAWAGSWSHTCHLLQKSNKETQYVRVPLGKYRCPVTWIADFDNARLAAPLPLHRDILFFATQFRYSWFQHSYGRDLRHMHAEVTLLDRVLGQLAGGRAMLGHQQVLRLETKGALRSDVLTRTVLGQDVLRLRGSTLDPDTHWPLVRRSLPAPDNLAAWSAGHGLQALQDTSTLPDSLSFLRGWFSATLPRDTDPSDRTLFYKPTPLPGRP